MVFRSPAHSVVMTTELTSQITWNLTLRPINDEVFTSFILCSPCSKYCQVWIQENEKKKLWLRAASQCGNSNLRTHYGTITLFISVACVSRVGWYFSYFLSDSICLSVCLWYQSIEIRLRKKKPQRSDMSLLIHSLMNGKTWKTGRLKSRKIGETRLWLNEMIRGQNLKEEKNCKNILINAVILNKLSTAARHICAHAFTPERTGQKSGKVFVLRSMPCI